MAGVCSDFPDVPKCNNPFRLQVCAVIFPEDNNWHRGVITGHNNAGFVEVYYVDYGNTNFVPKSYVKFLR